MFMLGNDLESLKAYSLACKALPVSTCDITLRKICLSRDKSWELLAVSLRSQGDRHIRGDRGSEVVQLSGEYLIWVRKRQSDDDLQA